MRQIVCTLFILLGTMVQSQNLVPNGDFEEFTIIPDDYGQISRAIGWKNLNGTFDYTNTNGSPDYYYNGGLQSNVALAAFSGNGQCGIVTYWNYSNQNNFREYVSTKLVKSLKKGGKYKLSFYFTNGLSSGAVNNGLGAAFTIDTLSQINRLPILVTPEVESLDIISSLNSWRNLAFVFTAIDTFQNITIGNFRNDANTIVQPAIFQTSAYYFIDNIELYEMKYTICQGDSIELEHFSRDTAYAWATADEPDVILSNQKTFAVSPMVNTTYLLYTGGDTIEFPVKVDLSLKEPLTPVESFCNGKPVILDAQNTGASTYLWQNGATEATFTANAPGLYYVTLKNQCGTRTDTVRVDTKCTTLLEMPNVFTPNGDGTNDLFIPIKAQQISNLSIYIFNRWGKQVAEIKPASNGWDGQQNNNPCPEGVYYWLANYTSPIGGQYSKKGYVQLIR